MILFLSQINSPFQGDRMAFWVELKRRNVFKAGVAYLVNYKMIYKKGGIYEIY
jgi:hypothetical protein